MAAPDKLDLMPPKMTKTSSSEPKLVPIFDVNEPMENDGLTAEQLFSNVGVARPALTYGCEQRWHASCCSCTCHSLSAFT